MEDLESQGCQNGLNCAVEKILGERIEDGHRVDIRYSLLESTISTLRTEELERFGEGQSENERIYNLAPLDTQFYKKLIIEELSKFNLNPTLLSRLCENLMKTSKASEKRYVESKFNEGILGTFKDFENKQVLLTDDCKATERLAVGKKISQFSQDRKRALKEIEEKYSKLDFDFSSVSKSLLILTVNVL